MNRVSFGIVLFSDGLQGSCYFRFMVMTAFP